MRVDGLEAALVWISILGTEEDQRCVPLTIMNAYIVWGRQRRLTGPTASY